MGSTYGAPGGWIALHILLRIGSSQADSACVYGILMQGLLLRSAPSFPGAQGMRFWNRGTARNVLFWDNPLQLCQLSHKLVMQIMPLLISGGMNPKPTSQPWLSLNGLRRVLQQQQH